MRPTRLTATLMGVTAFLSLSLAGPALAKAHAADGPQVLVPLDPNQAQLPESITTDVQGDLYFSGATDQIWKIPPGGQPVLFATLPLPQVNLPELSRPLGVKIGPDGYLYTVSVGIPSSLDESRVWRISPTGQVQEYAHLDPSGEPNDLAFDNRGNLYVTDTRLGEIWKIGQGGEPAGVTPTVWLSNPLLAPTPSNPGGLDGLSFGANGIAFDARKENLYVGNLDTGQIIKIAVDLNGQPGPMYVFASDPRLKGADGIAFAANGTLYVAVNSQNQIATVSSTGQVNALASGPIFDTPSSLVFGSEDGDAQGNTLYVANFALQELLNGTTPHPAILQMPVQTPGLSLP